MNYEAMSKIQKDIHNGDFDYVLATMTEKQKKENAHLAHILFDYIDYSQGIKDFSKEGKDYREANNFYLFKGQNFRQNLVRIPKGHSMIIELEQKNIKVMDYRTYYRQTLLFSLFLGIVGVFMFFVVIIPSIYYIGMLAYVTLGMLACILAIVILAGGGGSSGSGSDSSTLGKALLGGMGLAALGSSW
ncbi:hypothetical protein OFO01_07675 [Campylobacter sp. JMF_01 NE2]|uniref:hypothetical protein n=1 Tax=unclassified Campylobacter TaxID=2593542 RepID=UPI0022EA0281|nr:MULTISPECIES: hypothetical protein [unclassified Campylobacter]MDA3053318.1 hypothetical protein [Campylobacter sp. JMF_03 NE3]MDA3067662.1 hypothetical protein [Campylobacter sp. JMF_01 NE2]